MWKKIEQGFQWITNKLFGKAEPIGEVRGVVYYYDLGDRPDSLDFSVDVTGWMSSTTANRALVGSLIESYAGKKVFWKGDVLVPVEFKHGEVEYRHESE
jgi:hypothetical protein